MTTAIKDRPPKCPHCGSYWTEEYGTNYRCRKCLLVFPKKESEKC